MHIRRISRCKPNGAAEWQDLVCLVSHIAAGLVEAKSGTAPIVTYIDGKCAIPTTNTTP